MKAIIYYRKSTDTDDKQINSLEHQLNNCRRTAELNNLEIYKEIGESKSAKTEFTREWFNDMIKQAKLGRVDYIICDEPKRLSRNNLDTSRIIDLLDKKQIKGILCTSREYHGENSRDKFLLQLDLSLSKMDNEDRAKDIKDKMITAFKKGQWVAKAPIWYKNVTIKKGHKTIEIDIEKAPHIKRAFELRASWYSYERVSDYLFENNIYSNVSKKRICVEQMKRILNNKFYMWTMEWGWLEVQGNHKPIISPELFSKWSGAIPIKETIRTFRSSKYNFTGLLRGKEEDLGMAWYMNKWKVYYQAGYNATININISERLLFEKIHEFFKPFDDLPKPVQEITKQMLQDIYNKATHQRESDVEKIKIKIQSLKDKKDVLLDKFLEGEVEKEIYKTKTKSFDEEIRTLEKNLTSVTKISSKFHKTLKVHTELLLSLYSRYNWLSEDEKVNIFNSLKMSFILSSKKELYIADKSPYKALENLLFHIWYSYGELNSSSSLEKAVS